MLMLMRNEQVISEWEKEWPGQGPPLSFPPPRSSDHCGRCCHQAIKLPQITMAMFAVFICRALNCHLPTLASTPSASCLNCCLRGARLYCSSWARSAIITRLLILRLPAKIDSAAVPDADVVGPCADSSVASNSSKPRHSGVEHVPSGSQDRPSRTTALPLGQAHTPSPTTGPS